eukprot:Seg1837.2 transcript_id=Seg1837.2/GoldUCD/mRNA.D3Y31 product="Myosin heavy chain kinase B" protein_id=Seg1837.2/GoldUCD/D3Y31
MAEMVAIKLALGIAWKLFAPKTASKFEHGDIAEEKLRQLLLNEFQKLHEHLNALRRKELVAAVSFLETGYDLVTKDPHTAKEEFRKARDAALMAFGVVPEVIDKLLSTKILVLSTIHEFSDNAETAKTLVMKYVGRMNSLPEVVKICQVTFDTASTMKSKFLGLTGKAARNDALKSLADINYSAFEFVTGLYPDFDEPWPRAVWDASNIHPVYDLVLLRTSQTICHVDKEFGSIMSAIVSHGNIFVAFSQAYNVTEINKNVTVICEDTGAIRHLVGHEGSVLALATNDKFVFSGSYDKTIMVWNSESLECHKILKEHDGAVRSLCISEKYLYSGSTDSTVCIWSLEELNICQKIKVFSPVAFLTCSKKKFLYCMTFLYKVQIWDVTKLLNEGLEQPSCELSVSGNTNKLITSDNLLFACGKDSIDVIKLGSLRQEGTLNCPGSDAVLVPSNKFLVCRGKDLCLCSTRNGKVVLNERAAGETDVIVDYMWMNKGSLYISCYEPKSDKVIIKRW